MATFKCIQIWPAFWISQSDQQIWIPNYGFIMSFLHGNEKTIKAWRGVERGVGRMAFDWATRASFRCAFLPRFGSVEFMMKGANDVLFYTQLPDTNHSRSDRNICRLWVFPWSSQPVASFISVPNSFPSSLKGLLNHFPHHHQLSTMLSSSSLSSLSQLRVYKKGHSFLHLLRNLLFHQGGVWSLRSILFWSGNCLFGPWKVVVAWFLIWDSGGKRGESLNFFWLLIAKTKPLIRYLYQNIDWIKVLKGKQISWNTLEKINLKNSIKLDGYEIY